MANKQSDTSNHAKKRSFTEIDGSEINDSLEPTAKRQKLNVNAHENGNGNTNTDDIKDNNDDNGITKEDMEFLFQLKQQSQSATNNESSLHKNVGQNMNGNVTTDINTDTNFATASIASTNNSVAMSALSTTATIDKNPSLAGLNLPFDVTNTVFVGGIDVNAVNAAMDEPKKDKAAEKYYKQIVQRSSRVGDRYQAAILPTVQNEATIPSQDDDRFGGTFLGNDDAKYEGTSCNVDSPSSIGNKLRDERDEKRTNLDKKLNELHSKRQDAMSININHDDYDEEDDEDFDPEQPQQAQAQTQGIKFTDMNFDDDDDDEDDEDFNMDEYVKGNNNDDGNDGVRSIEGIMGRRSDWLPGDDGKPNDGDTKVQYLVKWKDSPTPVWVFADELDIYQEKIDQFEDDEMEDMLMECEDMTLINNQNDINKDKDLKTTNNLNGNNDSVADRSTEIEK